MTAHRFFVDPDQIRGDRVRFSPEQAHQLDRVLRLRAGDTVVALDGRGAAYDVTLTELSRRTASGTITGRRAANGEPDTTLILYQSLLRRDKFEWVLQKGTEVGVAVFVPVITRRSLVRDADKVTAERTERWTRILTEAAEQAGRGRVPDLQPPLPFADAVAEAVAGDGVALLASEDATGYGIPGALNPFRDLSRISLFIGPEGGFEPDEVDEAGSKGINIVTLGPRILRTETAAVVAAALVLHELGQMG